MSMRFGNGNNSKQSHSQTQFPSSGMRQWRCYHVRTSEQMLGEGGVTVRVGELRVGVLVLVAVTADTQVCPRAKYGAIAVREEGEVD